MVMLKKEANAWSVLGRMGKRGKKTALLQRCLGIQDRSRLGMESSLSAHCQTELKAFLEADQY